MDPLLISTTDQESLRKTLLSNRDAILHYFWQKRRLSGENPLPEAAEPGSGGQEEASQVPPSTRLEKFSLTLGVIGLALLGLLGVGGRFFFSV